MSKRFTVKDISFLAILAALLVLFSATTMPLMTITLYGLRNMANALFYGAFGMIALMKIRKPGALTLLCMFSSVILLLMSPVMFFNNTISAMLAELIALLIFRHYGKDKAKLVSAGLMIPMTLPMTIVFGMLINKQTFADIVDASWLIIPIIIGTLLLSFGGALLGKKIGIELRKAGKLL